MIFLDTKSIRPQVVLIRYTTCPSHWCGMVWQICEGEIGRCLCPTVWRHQEGQFAALSFTMHSITAKCKAEEITFAGVFVAAETHGQCLNHAHTASLSDHSQLHLPAKKCFNIFYVLPNITNFCAQSDATTEIYDGTSAVHLLLPGNKKILHEIENIAPTTTQVPCSST